MATLQQQSFELRTWGGKRRGAGRKRAAGRAAIPHTARDEIRPCYPVHVTLRMAEPVWNLRSERSYRIVHAALCAARRRPGFRIVHFSIQGNHVHVIAEGDGPRSFALGVRALSIRLARRLNAMMGRSGPVFSDRYHAHVLRTPAEVRNAVRYVLGNFESHAARRGEPTSKKGWVDPFSSAARRAPRHAQGSLFVEAATEPAGTWLLRHEGPRAGRNLAVRSPRDAPRASSRFAIRIDGAQNPGRRGVVAKRPAPRSRFPCVSRGGRMGRSALLRLLATSRHSAIADRQ
jgi:REP element-mobilizing transposase RayT